MEIPHSRPNGLSQRRAVRFSVPGPQLRLASSVLAVSLAFVGLLALNSYAAFGQLFGATLSLAPAELADEITAQTRHYLNVSAALFAGLAIAVTAVSAAALHRLFGPLVAVERHVRALAAGNYAHRIRLRSGDGVWSEVARRLNELAQDLEQGRTRR